MASNGFDLPVSADQAVCIARGQFEAGEVGRAAEVCRRLLKERPGFAPAQRLMGEVEFHRGNTLYSRGDFNGAVATYGRAVELCPGFLDALCNLGNALVAVGKIAEAIDAYERAISLNPDCSQAHWNLALALLARGDFERGWPKYEWRHREPSTPKCPGVAWKGEALAGKTILLIAEQGLTARGFNSLSPSYPLESF
jgi:tetratricopeptide (TPR) repeat protein